MSTPLGRFAWFDLMTTDPAAAAAFYTKVLGWGTDQWQMPIPDAPPYTMWTVNGVPFGGTMQLPPAEQAPPHWLGYMSTPDIKGTTARGVELGGRVLVEPTAIPTVGHFSVLLDPFGAAFSLFTPENEMPGRDGPAALGEQSWSELATTNLEAGFGFYANLLGWEKIEVHDMGELGQYLIWGRGGVPMGGAYVIGPQMPMPPCWLYYFRVDSAAAAGERCVAAGGTVIHGPMEVPGGDWITMCTDPQGAMFAVHQVGG